MEAFIFHLHYELL